MNGKMSARKLKAEKLQKNIVKVKDEVICLDEEDAEDALATPVNGKKSLPRRKAAAATTSKKSKLLDEQPESSKATAKKTKISRTTKTEPPKNQLRIDSFFKSGTKTYQIKAEVRQSSSKTTIPSQSKCITRSKAKKGAGTAGRTVVLTKVTKGKGGRKRLFRETDTETETSASISGITDMSLLPRERPNKKRKSFDNINTCKTVKPSPETPLECVDLCSDSEQEECNEVKNVIPQQNPVTEKSNDLSNLGIVTPSTSNRCTKSTFSSLTIKSTTKVSRASACDMTGVTALAEVIVTKESTQTSEYSGEASIPPVVAACSNTSKRTVKSVLPPTSTTTRCRKPRPCPPYKIVAGTTFAVDAFQYGEIEGVTHYFLTHFHADHYIGLTRKFSMPLYLSPITARLVRAFIPVENQYICEITLNKPINIAGVEVQAIDANHCPGAIMLLFKLSCGKCILHTGDFRASAEMESEPIFWNHDIHTIYLDTTYISDKYAFCTQYESIDIAMELVRDFQAKHVSKRILYICGSYVIGKEKFWSALAEEFKLKVWTEANRLKALKAMSPLMPFAKLLCDNPYSASMHIIGLGTLNYMSLMEYVQHFESHFDVILAIRPSGWEKNSRPQYRGKVNIVGVEYSEHSSYSELERFVSYLKPREVISTVPVNRNPLICGKVPQKWYKYDSLKGNKRNCQTSITSYMKLACVKTNSNGIKQHTTPAKSVGNVQISPLTSTIGRLADSSSNETENRMPKRRLEYTNHNDKPNHAGAMHANNCDYAIASTSTLKTEPIDLDADAADDWMS